jgi:ArsR family transcriptional regulator
MPALVTDLVRTPTQTTIEIALDPANSVLNSLHILHKADHFSGLHEWVAQTVASLSPERLHTNRLVFEGLFHAVEPRRRWSSFPAFLDHLASQDPLLLRDRMLDAYNNACCDDDAPEGKQSDPEEVLASLDSFLDHLKRGFPAEAIDVEIEREAYALLVDPPALREKIVSHLRAMWAEVMEAEWERNLPMLQTCVAANQELDLADLSIPEAAQQVTGKALPETWLEKLSRMDIDQVVFVPSAHLGPYRGLSYANGTLWLLFGARLPEGAQISSPDLSRSELLVRLNALADDNRLRILHTLKTEWELCSKDIMEQLDLSQSAASRHLKQLSATGYVGEQRKNGAKCYRLNEERVEDTLRALSHFLLG